MSQSTREQQEWREEPSGQQKMVLIIIMFRNVIALHCVQALQREEEETTRGSIALYVVLRGAASAGRSDHYQIL